MMGCLKKLKVVLSALGIFGALIAWDLRPAVVENHRLQEEERAYSVEESKRATPDVASFLACSSKLDHRSGSDSQEVGLLPYG
jgi:hypothetical protein